MKVEKREKLLSVDDILFLTNGGKDIFDRYLTKVKPLMKRPWGTDKKPSWGVFERRGKFYWKDQATEEWGNAIDFVMRLFGLSFQEAADKIKWDFQLGGKNIPADAVYKIKTDTDKPKHISVETMPFQRRHHEFWNCVSVSEAWCKKFDCYAIKSAAIDRQRYYISTDEPVFGYYAKEEQHWKLYFPNRKGMQRFRNNVSYHYLWNYTKLECCEKLIIQKSPKDMIVTALIYPHVIATQAEHLKIFNEATVEDITEVATEVYISYGSDEDGKRKSINISKEFAWKWVNPPNKFLPEVNDVYSLVKKHGLIELNNMLKAKNII